MFKFIAFIKFDCISLKGYELCPNVKVIATPGHTAEDVTVLVKTTKEKMLLAVTGIYRSFLDKDFKLYLTKSFLFNFFNYIFLLIVHLYIILHKYSYNFRRFI